jgi:hypothetical protein
VWHSTLCQTMDYPTVDTLAQSLYDVVLHLLVADEQDYEIIKEEFRKWATPFESFEEIEESVYMTYFWVEALNSHRSGTLENEVLFSECLG